MIEILRAARQSAIDKFKGLGEPLIELPQEGVFIREAADGTKVVSITATQFIYLADAFIKANKPKEA